MRKFLFRVENLLLLFPLLLFVVPDVYIGNNALDIHLHDTYFVVDLFYFYLALLILFLIPYLLHALLRYKQKRNAPICKLHVIITVFLVILFFVFIFVEMFDTAPISSDGSIENVFHSSGAVKLKVDMMAFTLGSLVLIQVLFLLHFLIALIRFKRSNH